MPRATTWPVRLGMFSGAAARHHQRRNRSEHSQNPRETHRTMLSWGRSAAAIARPMTGRRGHGSDRAVRETGCPRLSGEGCTCYDSLCYVGPLTTIAIPKELPDEPVRRARRRQHRCRSAAGRGRDLRDDADGAAGHQASRCRGATRSRQCSTGSSTATEASMRTASADPRTR